MSSEVSALQRWRAQYEPALPKVLRGKSCKLLETDQRVTGTTAQDQDKVRADFPYTCGKRVVQIVEGPGPLPRGPISVGVVLSGGQAPGGHNVIAGLFDALKAAHPGSKLLGFKGGPIGVINNDADEITAAGLDAYRNTGGFDMICTGRDKIEQPEQFQKCLRHLLARGCRALVVAGGDDSNTNAAHLAEYLAAKAQGEPIQVIGVPKTIDDDLRNNLIEQSFGFDTAAKSYAELVGNICRDCLSARKYWHFIRLMGRSASHITLEAALQTHPNYTLISEEVHHLGWTLDQVVDKLYEIIRKRADAGKSYGIVLVPEGLIEFLADANRLIGELKNEFDKHTLKQIRALPSHAKRVQRVNRRLGDEARHTYSSLPEDVQELLLKRDDHDNIPVSQIETEKMLLEMLAARIDPLVKDKTFPGEFKSLNHFFGYEGRCVAPSNFDATYAYALGYAAAQLILGGLTGYTVAATNLSRPPEQWLLGGVPITSMLHIETRKGKESWVIKKTLVDLNGRPFQTLAQARDAWLMDDDYVYPGPIQYFGPPEVCDLLTKTLVLEHP